MGEKLTTFDPAELLNSIDALVIFIAAALESGEASDIAHALGRGRPHPRHAQDR